MSSSAIYLQMRTKSGGVPVSDFRLDFVGGGPQRTGSTWLDRVLRAHPALCLPENVKETKFFDQHFNKGLDWYA